MPERSVTPDITRDLGNRKYDSIGRSKYAVDMQSDFKEQYTQQPRQYHLYQQNNQNATNTVQVPSTHNDSLKISPIDPKNSTSFKCSTPTHKATELKSAVNLESRLLSPKKSTMTNEELYAVIHKSKKKLNISNEEIDRASPVDMDFSPKPIPKSPETGYLGDKSRTRLSWSPGTADDLVDFKDKFSNESRSRQSWACKDRKGPAQTSRLDFKKLLLQHSKPSVPTKNNKLSAVEQLKLSKQQIQPIKHQQDDMSILELSRSPRSIGNRKFNTLNSPRGNQEKSRPVPKLLSPRSQWRFASPRSDVLSSTIPEDCREDESPNSSGERRSKVLEENNTKSVVQNLFGTNKSIGNYKNITERIQAQRAQFFGTSSSTNDCSYRNRDTPDKSVLPTLETAF